MNTVTRAFLRYLPRRRALTALQLVGIAVGVASAIGMALSARSALSSFSRAVDFLQGRSTHSISRPAGPMEESLLTPLMGDSDVVAFSPVIERRMGFGEGGSLRVLGVDPFLDRRFRPGLAPPDTGDEFPFLFEERAVLVGAGLGRELGLTTGDQIATSRGQFRIVGTFPNPSGEPLLLMDIRNAQRIFDLAGRVSRVDLILADEEAFRARWGEGFLVRSTQQQRVTMGEMLHAFRLNLQALSLLGLFVGVFLVYNTAMFAVVSRRRDAGILLSLGAERSEVASAFLVELLLLGGVGGLLGALLGFGLSRFLTGLVGNAISGLYFFLRPAPPTWSWSVAVGGILLGWAACFLGGAYPLLELARTDPVGALRGRGFRRSSRGRAVQAALAGVGVVALSMSLFPPASVHVYAGFAGAFGLVLGAGLLVGVALDRMGPLLEGFWDRCAGLTGRIAAGNIRRNLGRTAVAVAAFMVALSMTIGLGLMIGSFRHSLVWWMEGQLTGEVYVASSADVQVPEPFYQELKQLDGIGGVDPYRNVQIFYQGAAVYVSSVDAAVLQEYAEFGWVTGGEENWDAVVNGAVVVSESFFRRFSMGAGDTVTLLGVEGPVVLNVAGVFYDYTTEHGLIMMDRSTYRLIFRDPSIDSLGIFLASDVADRGAVLAQVRRLAEQQGLPVLTRDQLHWNILEVFDATFAATRSMRVLAVVVAFFGIAGALLTLSMERQREFGIYRALGFSRSQVGSMTLLEGLGMGLCSLVLSIVLGSLLALVLIRVINLHSFHWTIFFHFLWRPYGIAAGTAVAASIGAAAYPIWRVYRSFPQMQIREE